MSVALADASQSATKPCHPWRRLSSAVFGRLAFGFAGMSASALKDTFACVGTCSCMYARGLPATPRAHNLNTARGLPATPRAHNLNNARGLPATPRALPVVL